MTRIQNLEYRIQKAENAPRGEDAVGAVVRIFTERRWLWIAFLQTERSLMFAYVRLKSLMFAYFEKKYFFPALWSSGTRTQGVGGVKTVESCWLRVEGLSAPDESAAVSDVRAELSGKNYGFFRDVSRFYAQIRAVVTRFYAFLRVRLFFETLAIFDQIWRPRLHWIPTLTVGAWDS